MVNITKVRTARRLVFGCVGAAMLMTAACGSSGSEGSASSSNPNVVPRDTSAPLYGALPEAYQDKRIKVVLDPGFGVLNAVKEGSKEFDGLNADLAKAVAKELGAEVELVPAKFTQILLGVTNDRYDLSMSAVTDTVERQAEVDFVDYVKVSQALFVQKGNPKKITSDILSACGMKLSVVPATTDENLFKQIDAACRAAGETAPEVVNTDSVDAAYVAIESGRIDAMIRENSSNRENTTAERIDLDYGSSYYFGAIFDKDKTDLRDAWLKGIEGIVKSGEYSKILEENNQTAISFETPGVNLQK